MLVLLYVNSCDKRIYTININVSMPSNKSRIFQITIFKSGLEAAINLKIQDIVKTLYHFLQQKIFGNSWSRVTNHDETESYVLD